jgi:hypothetical protein
MDKTIVMQWWLEPRSGVPAGAEECIDWLYQWWGRVDRWIAENRPSTAAI